MIGLIRNKGFLDVWSQRGLLALLVIFPTLYAYLNATLIDYIGDGFFQIFLMISVALFLIRGKQHISRTVIRYLWVYLFWSFFSILYADYASLNWFGPSFFRLGFCVIISCVLVELKGGDRIFLRNLLFSITIILSVFVILDHYGFFDKRWLSFITPLEVFEQKDINAERWCGKYFASWLTLLVWGAVALFWSAGGKGKKILAIILFCCAIIAVSKLPSQGAILANGVAFISFVLLNIFDFKKYRILYCCILLFPVIVSFLLLSILTFSPVASGSDTAEEMKKIRGLNSIISRVNLYNDAAEAFKKKPLVGHGFGSVRSLYFSNGGDVINPKTDRLVFQGGHPHNLGFLFFVEHGVFGFIFLSLVVYSFYRYIYSQSIIYRGVEFVIPLVMSYQMIHFFSFAIWQADIVILLTFFFLLVRIVIETNKQCTSTEGNDVAGFH